MDRDNDQAKVKEMVSQWGDGFAWDVIETLGQGVTILGANGRFKYVNPAYAKMVGRSTEELIGKSPFDFTHPDDLQQIQQAKQQRLSGERSTYEIRLVQPDGTLVHAHITGVPRREGNQFVGSYAIVTDLTAHKQTEKALQESKEQSAGIVASAMDAIISIDEDQRIVLFNAAAEMMFGWSAADIIGQPHDVLIPERFRAVHRQHVQYFGQTGETNRNMDSLGIMWGLRTNGQEFPVEVSISQVMIGSKKLYTVIIRDVTERLQAEQALNESVKRYRSLLDNMLEGCQIIGFDWRYLYVNDAVAEQGRQTKEALLGRTMMEIYPGIEQTEMFAVLQRCMDERVTAHIENEFVYPDDSKGWFELRVQPIPEGVFILSFDITEQKEAEIALHQSESRYRSVVEDMPGLLCRFHPDGVLEYVNDTYAGTFDYQPEALIGQSFLSLIPPENRSTVMADLDALTPESPMMTHEHPVIVTGGEVRWQRWTNRLLLDDTGTITGYQAFGLDITERKRAEQAIYLMSDTQKQIAQINNLKEIYQLVGRQIRELIGDGYTITSMFDETIQAMRIAGLYGFGSNRYQTLVRRFNIDPTRMVYSLADMTEEELRIFRSGKLEKFDGGLYALFTRKVPKRICEAVEKRLKISAIYTMGFVWHDLHYGGLTILAERDITLYKEMIETIMNQASIAIKRAKSEDALHQSETQLQHIIDTVPEGVLLLAADGAIILTNPIAERYLSILVPEWENGRITHLGKRPLNDLLTSPPKGTWHDIVSDKYTFATIARPIEVSPNNAGWVLVLRDVTQERDIQQRVQRQERLAAVGQLAAGIAHDFNNIIAVIALYTQLISRTVEMPVNAQEKLHTIEKQALRATDLIQQILDFSRQSVLERRPLDLLPFMKELVKLLNRTLPENIRIELVCMENTYLIYADPSRIQQAIMNLAVNARDAMPQGGQLHIEITHAHIKKQKHLPVRDMQPGNWIQIEVTDTGSGIAPEALSQIFEPFFTTKEVGEGTGLGLAQVYGIVQQHGGYIDVDTKVGQGTIFTLYLPTLDTDERKADLPDQASLYHGQGQVVLVVEDNPDIRQALLDSLTLMSYGVIDAANGREALSILETKPNNVALVLSDVVMPEMGGIALFHAMQQKNISTPLVLLTGHPLSKEMEDLQTLGLAGWLPKPPDIVKLSQLLAQVLST